MPLKAFMKIKISGIGATFKQLQKQVVKLSEKDLQAKGELILSDLQSVTPVDTGVAAAGWKLETHRTYVVLENNVEYIEALNDGHSKQAPANFVEQVALKYGKPIGRIVTNTP
jgi:hypothetical protein